MLKVFKKSLLYKILQQSETTSFFNVHLPTVNYIFNLFQINLENLDFIIIANNKIKVFHLSHFDV